MSTLDMSYTETTPEQIVQFKTWFILKKIKEAHLSQPSNRGYKTGYADGTHGLTYGNYIWPGEWEKNDDAPDMENWESIIEKLVSQGAFTVVAPMYTPQSRGLFIQIHEEKFNEIYSRFKENSVPSRSLQDSSKVHSIVFKKTSPADSHYEIIINGGTRVKIKKKGRDDSWPALYQIATRTFYIAPSKKRAKHTMDYFNTNSSCPLYSKGKFQLSAILTNEGERITSRSGIELTLVTSKKWSFLIKS